MKKKFIDKKLQSFIILVGSIAFLSLSIYKISLDIDYFITKKEDFGLIKSFDKAANYYYVGVNYLNVYTGKSVTINKRFHIKYFKSLKNIIQGENSAIEYTRWFNQLFVSGINKPTLAFFVFTILMVLLFTFGVRIGMHDLRLM